MSLHERIMNEQKLKNINARYTESLAGVFDKQKERFATFIYSRNICFC